MNKKKPGKKLGRTSKDKKKNLAHKSNYLPADDWADDFVFPVFSSQELKSKKKTSPHVLDLKQLRKSQFRQSIKTDLEFNADDWFSNLEQYRRQDRKIQPLLAEYRNSIIDQPEDEDYDPKKIELYKPPKIKKTSGLTIDLIERRAEKPTSKLKQVASTHSWLKLILIPFKISWIVISAPFKFLDFVVDRGLKLIWKIIKLIVLSFISVFKNLFTNLKTILTFKPAKVNLKFSYPSLPFKKLNYRPVLTFGIVCLVVVLPLQILNWQQKTTQLKSQVLGQSIQGLDFLKQASVSSQNLNFNQANYQFEQAYLNFNLAQNYLDSLGILSKQLIKAVPEANQANNLLNIGQLSADIGQQISSLAQQLQNTNLTDGQNSEKTLSQKVKIVSDGLTNIKPTIDELLTRSKQIDTDILNKYIDPNDMEKVVLFKASIPELEDIFNRIYSLNELLGSLIGQKNSQKFLVIFQNNTELRPTGGFMGSYALIEIKNGEIIKTDVPGGGFYDLQAASTTQVAAPKPLQHLNVGWNIWDANWFVDWSTSAKKILWFYENTLNGETVDGIITLTPDMIIDLLKITGPIEMPEYETTVTAENFIYEVQKEVEFNYDQEENKPKKIIGDLMTKLLDKLLTVKVGDTPKLLQTLNENLVEKNILLWFRNDEIQQTVKDFGWAGEIVDSQSDYLMLVQTNVGGTKTDQVIDTKMTHQINIESDGSLVDTVVLTREHNGDLDNIFENKDNIDYLRLYVPQGSQLIEASGFDKPPVQFQIAAAGESELAADIHLAEIETDQILDEQTGTRITNEFNKTSFGNWSILKPGDKKNITLKYKLPFKAELVAPNWWQKMTSFVKPYTQSSWRYNLIIQKQPGVKDIDFSSHINLPDRFEIKDSNAKNDLFKQNQTIFYQDNLSTDGYYTLEIEPAS